MEKTIFLSGKYVNLFVLSEKHLVNSKWLQLVNDQDISMYSSNSIFPVTKAEQLERIINRKKNNLDLGVIDKRRKNFIGLISLQRIDLVNRNAEIATLFDIKKNKNIANFYESMILIIKHGFEELNLEKIYGGSINPNTFIALRKMFNFTKEGIRKRHVFKNNKYYDIIMFAVNRKKIKYPIL